MATEALNQRRYPWTGTMRSRLAVVNAVAFTLGTAASMMAGAGAAKGFIAGYAIGMASPMKVETTIMMPMEAIVASPLMAPPSFFSSMP